MTDLCKQCSMEIFGEDSKDLAGLISAKLVANGHGTLVICEGCGITLVDHEGSCIDQDCKKHGKATSRDLLENS